MKESKKKMNLPNKLTILRVLLVPVFVACILYIPNVIERSAAKTINLSAKGSIILPKFDT